MILAMLAGVEPPNVRALAAIEDGGDGDRASRDAVGSEALRP
jgi:hypothetical protein